MMTKIDKNKLGQIIDACVEASEKIDHVEISIKGLCTELKNEIDEITAKLYFDYRTQADDEEIE